MIIGSKLDQKNRNFLQELARLSEGEAGKKIAVKRVNNVTGFDRTQVRNILEHLEQLGHIHIKTIGGPWLYGHVAITPRGLQQACKK